MVRGSCICGSSDKSWSIWDNGMSSNFNNASPKNIPPPMKLLSLTVINTYESCSRCGSCRITLENKYKITMCLFIMMHTKTCIDIAYISKFYYTYKSNVSSNNGNNVLRWVRVFCFGQSWNLIEGTILIDTYGSHCPALFAVWNWTLAYWKKIRIEVMTLSWRSMSL